ncbi:hypothetical protein NDU88_002988 [Pleurodeles waltl]|uniref:Uncharacterized protein n=1 Tax=Pleurodeles waltl TaxID=8319 RepID=A0AAV7WU12_PLEWA|nr:hypothetical protein NDU88_002988 [Pleurodeles waltl]
MTGSRSASLGSLFVEFSFTSRARHTCMAGSGLRESFSRCSCVRGPIHWGPGPGAQRRCLRRQSLHSERPPGEQALHRSAAGVEFTAPP